ncbi:hypothetical protein FA15DRAFT_761402 [Coprinopsis marcescibilis]|uniref:Uncharacterized protein n=1 Tax=Coprinopsis marcescibilis TaxID=230819 RepID=A0A5C3KA43_COPMA|nr:hypothetical protein FA15DRAFT_761402 [Coprinopsis marcescibilis]
MSVTRYVVIDDDHPDISYTGTWEVDPVQHEGLYNSGTVGSSQQRITGTGSISFTFQGTYISLYGTKTNGLTQNIEALKWECKVDEIVFQPRLPLEAVGNIYQYCGIFGLDPSTEHTLTVDIEASEEAPFWIDAIEFYPYYSNEAYREALARNTYYVQHLINDTTIGYSPGWQALPETQLQVARYTSTPNSVVEIDFIGTQVTWKGIALTNQPLAGDSQATYSVDGGPAVPFTVPRRLSSSGQYQLFETEKLPRNLHHLKVVYGEGSEAPLVLNYMLITDGDIIFRNPRALGPELDGLRVDPYTRPSNQQQPERPPAAAIAGGVVGSVVGLLVIFFVIYWRRGRNRKSVKASNNQDAENSAGDGAQVNVGYHDQRSDKASNHGVSAFPNANNLAFDGAHVNVAKTVVINNNAYYN